MSFSVSEAGIHLRTFSRNQTFGWAQIATCLAARDYLSIMYREPASPSGFGSAKLSHRHARQALASPQFPRSSLSRRGAEFVGLTASEAVAFGPPPETRWLAPGPDRSVADLLRSKLPRPDSSFIPTKRVGVWPVGVAFDIGDGPVGEPGERILPWDLLDPWNKPAVDSCFQFGWPVGKPGHYEQFLVTIPQARLILEFPSNRIWDASAEVRRSLGMT